MYNNRNLQVIEALISLTQLKKAFACRLTQLAIALCLLAMMPSGAQAQQRKVTLSVKDITVSQCLKTIEQKTGISFFVNGKNIDMTRKVSISAQKKNVEQVLQELFAGTNVSYKLVDNRYVLSAKQRKAAPQSTKKRTVKGTVKDKSGEPLIGVSIILKGTSTATLTDIDGNYTLSVPQDNATLEFTYIGYTAQEITVKGETLNVLMAEESQALGEVVVTALGIKKEAKALTYNVQQLNSGDVTGVKDANFMNSLSGKVAGVQINSASSGIGGGVKVVMRGTKSISGNNNALYVIDGIPMPQLQTTQPNDLYTGMGQSGDGASMLNPEDIESMSVLSGAAASALYGSDAANGVIMITTRKGQNERLRINYSNSTSFFDPFITPEFQNTYGAQTGSFSSWGDKLATPSNYKPTDFFQTGWNTMNSVTLSNGNEKNQTFLSLSSTNAEGIVPNNELARYNFTVRNTTSSMGGKLRIDLGASYMSIREKNMISQGQYFNPIVPIYLMSPSYSLSTYQHYEMYDESRALKTQYWPWGNNGIGMQNPYWIINRDNFVNHKNRFMINGSVNYDIAKGISIGARAKMDYTSAMYEKMYGASTDAIFCQEMGGYYKGDATTRQLYGDIMLNIDRYFGDFSLTATVGTSIQDLNYKYFDIGGSLNSVANSFTILNLKQSAIKLQNEAYHDQTQSVFATAQLGWQSKVYLDLTGRIDWASALAWTQDDYVAYPSVGLSAILTDLLSIKSKVLSFLKIRGSWSEVGNAPTRYIAYQTHPYESGTPTTTTTYPNSNIKPERTKAWEVGLQANLWGEKIAVNLSLYKTSTFNQLFNPSLPSSSGYSSIYINGGQVDNRGIEASVSLNQPLGPINWNSTFTYTLNRNKIRKLLKHTILEEGLEIQQDMLDLAGIGNVKTRLVEGGSIGDLYVTTLRRDSHGFIDVDYVNNTVSVDHTAGDRHDGWVYAGNSNAKYTMGWRNTLSWKGLSLSWLFNVRVGGEVVSLTQAMMDVYGTSKASAEARDRGYVLVDGYPLHAVQKYYTTIGNGAGSMYVYSATNVRLGELSVGYDIPINKYVPWIQGLNLSFTGRNLLMLYCKAPFDPELTASTGTHFSGMDYFMLPSLRNLGFSARINF